MLLALVAISRGSELSLLNLSFLEKLSNKYVFWLNKTVKHSKLGRVPPPVEIFRFHDRVKLCPVTTLEAYIVMSEGWRKGESQLLLSHRNPHKAVCKSSIARWLKQMLHMAGIDTNIFQAHSIRGAASSKAGVRGLSVPNILARGNWSNESTWQRFYHREVGKTTAESFQEKILKL